MAEFPSGTTQSYCLAGLQVVSEIPLTGLLPAKNMAPMRDSVFIKRAAVSQGTNTTFARHGTIAYDGQDLLLRIDGVARYLVRKGEQILVDAEPDSDANDVRAYLLGSAFGTLCLQRGITPLHSSAIDIAGGAAVFMGHSGAGKSTLAATLVTRGHQLVADDVSFITLDEKGAPMVWPGIRPIRLWEDAVHALGLDRPGVEREFRGYNKYLVPVPSSPDPDTPRPLLRMYLLSAAPAGAEAAVTQVSGYRAFELLMQNLYCSSFAECMGMKSDAFGVCAAIAREVPLFEFSRPRGFDVLTEGIERLERHLAAPITPLR